MTNKIQIAQTLFERLSANDVAGALALLADDVQWRLAGKPESLRTAGAYDKERMRRLFERMFSQLPNGLQIEVTHAIASGDHVALEARSRGDLANGRQYRQEYHFAIDFRGDRIAAVREYYDTQHVHDIWLRA